MLTFEFSFHEMHRDERIKDGDIDPIAPDRGDDGIAQLSVYEYAARLFDCQPERVLMAGV